MSPIPLGFLASAGKSAGFGYELISTSILGSNAASVTFSSLNTVASSYKHLQLRISARATTGGDQNSLQVRFNNDAGFNCYTHSMYALNSSQIYGQGFGARDAIQVDSIPSAANVANMFSSNIIDIFDFSSTVKKKTLRSRYGVSGYSSSSYGVGITSGMWNSTAAITSILIYISGNNILAGSRFSLYGIRG